jgi:hypothetical protein
MSINSQKLLPQSKIGSSSSIVKVGKMIPTLYKGSRNLKPQDDDNGAIVTIKKQVASISRIVSDNTLLRKKSQEQDKKESENKKRDEKESRLEGKKGSGLLKALVGTIPQLGFLDAINRFITFTFLGWAFKKIYPYLPQILGFLKNIQPIIQFFETLSINFFKGVVDFIDFGYKAYDKVREFTKNLGGEPFQKAFDDFSKNLNTFINLALVAGMLATGGPSLRRPGGGPGGGRPGGGSYRNGVRTGQYNGFNTRTSRSGSLLSRTGDALRGQRGDFSTSGFIKSEKDIMKRYFQRFGRDKFIQRFGEAGLEALPSGMQRGLLQRGARSVFTGLLGKGGAKVVLNFVRPFTKRLPIIGGLLDFGLSVALGEKIGRSAFRAIGSVLLGAIGAAVGGPFALLTGLAGSTLGDIAGGALYDLFFENKKPEGKPVKAAASGGKVTTRKGKVVGGKVKRSVRRIYSAPKSKQIKSGASVGGEKKLKQLFPEPPKNQMNKMMNPYGFLTNTAKRFGEIPAIGPIFNIFGKVLKGDMPTKDDFRIIGSSFNAWINNAITKGLLQGNLMSAFAEGGMIDIETQIKRDISGWVERSVEDLVKNKVTEAINEMRKNLRLKQLISGSGDNIPSSDAGNIELRGNVASKSVQVAKYLKSKYGLTDIQASAIVGVLLREGFGKGRPDDIEDSYGTFGPPPIGTDRVGYGWAQWTNVGSSKRLDNIARAIGVTDRPWTDMDNLRALDWELTNNSTYKKGLEELKKQSDIEKATEVWADYFEAGGYPGALVRNYGRSKLNDRIGSARAVLRRFQTGKDDEGRPLEQAVVTPGSMVPGDGRFIQGNSGDSVGVHFHVGTTKPGDSSGSTAAAFRVIKHFLGKKSVHIGRSREDIPTGATDDQIRGYIARGMAAHATGGRGPTEIDIQVGGAYGQGNRVPFPLALKNLTYSETGGYGTKADIVGVNAFVGHGRYKPDGSLAKQQGTVLNAGTPDFYYKKGGQIGEEKVKPLQREASYDRQDTQIFILPIEIIKEVPIQSPLNRSSKYSSRVPM